MATENPATYRLMRELSRMHTLICELEADIVNEPSLQHMGRAEHLGDKALLARALNERACHMLEELATAAAKAAKEAHDAQ